MNRKLTRLIRDPSTRSPQLSHSSLKRRELIRYGLPAPPVRVSFANLRSGSTIYSEFDEVSVKQRYGPKTRQRETKDVHTAVEWI